MLPRAQPRQTGFNFTRRQNPRGFTLIEALVVTAIVAILVSIGAITFSTIARKSQRQAVLADIADLEGKIQVARARARAPLGTITGNWNSSSACNGVPVQTTPACVNNLTTSWSWVYTGAPPRDPWGSIYLINENEKESGAPNPCVNDRLSSAGPDRIGNNADDIGVDLMSFLGGC